MVTSSDKRFGSQSMVAPLRRVLVRRPDTAFQVEDPLQWNYTSRPDLDSAIREHDGLAAVLEEAGVEVVYHAEPLPGKADAIFVFDPVLMTGEGAVLLRMGKPLRQGEERSLEGRLGELGIPTIGALNGEATAEGGDMFWLDPQTLAVGRGFRTNGEGIRQLREILGPRGVTVEAFDLPYFEGPKACLHLLSLLSLVDEKAAVVYPRLLPVRLWEIFRSRGFELIEVPDEEFLTMGPNVLAVAPRHCIALRNNEVTIKRLEQAGCRVETYRGDELSLKAEGGATCLTLPLEREFRCL